MSKFLSICIPTKGRIELVKNTLDSIYNNCNASFDDFEVVLSDNSDDDLLPQLLVAYKQYPNIIYTKTNVPGFFNSINALSSANGQLLKLHNDYTMLKEGTLLEMIDYIKSHIVIKPFVFFSNGELRRPDVQNYNSFDTFLNDISFYSTWSTAFSIWKEDFDKMDKTNLNTIFPHTTLLFNSYNKENFVVYNKVLFHNIEVLKKGGYNIFQAFSVQYLDMVNDSFKQSNINKVTFRKLKKNLFDKFLILWYYKTKIEPNQYTYDLSGIKSSISFYYSKFDYYRLIAAAFKLAFLKKAKRTLLSIISSKH